jgi:uncharacterized protein YndB with AHSA1/START domain
MTNHVALGAFVDKHTLRFELTYPHPVSRLWDALVDPQQLAQWFMPVEMEPRPGGRFVMPRPEGRPPRGSGTVTVFEPERLLELSFEAGENHFGPGCVVRFELAPHDGGSRISFVHRLASDVVYTHRPDAQPAGPGTFPPGTAAGWHGFADGLARLLEGDTPPLYDDSDQTVMDERAVIYAGVIEDARRGWEEA